MPFTSGLTPVAIIVPATWVEWSLIVEALSSWVTLPVNSTWVGRGLASSQMANFPCRIAEDPFRFSPVLPPGQSRLVWMVAAEMILSFTQIYKGFPLLSTPCSTATLPCLFFTVRGQPFCLARDKSKCWIVFSFWAVSRLACSRIDLFVVVWDRAGILKVDKNSSVKGTIQFFCIVIIYITSSPANFLR